MGSLVYVGGLGLEDAYAIRGIDGATVGEELRRIVYAGEARPGFLKPHAYLELHIEQGPVLESEGVVIGAVEGITGLSWTEVSITGRAAHAGTTPMHPPCRALPQSRERGGGTRGPHGRLAQHR